MNTPRSIIALLALAITLPASARATNAAAPTVAQLSAVTAKGMLRLASVQPLVLGERFEVRLTLGRVAPDTADRALYLRWFEAGQAPKSIVEGWVVHDGDVAPRPSVEIPRASAAPPTVSVVAPFARPGAYELRLYRSVGSWHSGTLLDTLRVDVVAKREPQALKLAPRRSFQPGEAIEVEVNLSDNRYYQGTQTGPNVVVYPLEVQGRSIPRAEALTWLSNTWGCTVTCASLAGQTRIASTTNPFSPYLRSVTKPGRYKVRPGLKALGIDQEPLFAPKMPGRYEVRLYDRGFGEPAAGYADLYIAAVEIVVTESASPVVRLVPRCAAGPNDAIEPLKAIRRGEPFFVEAIFAPTAEEARAARRTATVNSLASGATVEREVALTRVAPGRYCSGPVLAVASPDPRKTEGVTP